MAEELTQLQSHDLYRQRRRLQSAQGRHIRLGGRELLNFTSNNYLDLAADRRLARAASRAARRYGCGAGASPLVSGYLPPLRALERALAAWEGTESALTFASGFAANLAVLTSLVGPEDAIFSDEWNHASLIDGCRLSRARVHVYCHGRIDHLANLLHRQGASARRRLIVSDTLFSMDGDLAPLADLMRLAGTHDATVVVDEAHATGVLGANGRGVTELVPVDAQPEGDRLIKVGTMSKALGTQGGFVCGSRRLIDWLVNRARPYIFSTALAPPLAAAARRAVALVVEEPQRRHRLLALASCLRERLRAARLPDSGSACQIVPVVVGEARAAVELSARLREDGLLVPAIRPPSVPVGTARLRISLTAAHTPDDVACLVDGLKARWI
jgi:8-amino-7-oxononanoate synthase